MKKGLFAGLAVATVIIIGITLPAQAAPGIYLGMGFGGVFPGYDGSHLDGIEWDNGGNWELNGGINFNKNVGLNMQFGQMFGEAETDAIKDLTYSQVYFSTGLHLVYDSQDPSQNLTSKFQPYVDLGFGIYGLTLDTSDWAITETYDPALGLRVAVGMNMFLIEKTNLYIAPEISYHLVDYDTSTWEDPSGTYYLDGLDAGGNALLVQVKIGYHFLSGNNQLAAR